MKYIVLFIMIFLCFNLFSQTAIAPAAGQGTIANPFQIATLNNLYWIAASSTRWSLHYIQTVDIDASSTSGWFAGAGWIPIGNNTTQFTGSYNGQDFVISGLYINRTTDFIGLFGYAYGATIQNVALVNVNITGNTRVGALVGWNRYSSLVEKCSSSGAVNGANTVGGLVGWNQYSAIVRNSSSRGSVTASSFWIGGLVGYNSADALIEDSYSRSSVSGTYLVGGLTAQNDYSTITKAYSTGSVSGGSDTGGLVASSTGGITVSYWNTQTSGQASSAGGAGRTTAAMTYPYAADTYVGWDFTFIWAADTAYGVNNGYPYHRSLFEIDPIALPFTEDWSSGNFTENNWTADSNWSVDSTIGNPSPSARFFYSPTQNNYNLILSSWELDATGLNDVRVQFDYRLDNFLLTTLEQLTFEVHNGSSWISIATFSNSGGNIPWTTVNYDISPHASNRIFKVRFRAHGENSYNIDWWLIDNIQLKRSPFSLPFNEDWSSGDFTENIWSAEGNWMVSNVYGNPPPAARFYYSPSQSNYSMNLVSWEFDAIELDNVVVQFDYLLINYSTSTLEELSFEVHDGSSWVEIANFNNSGGNIPWTNMDIDISDHASNRIFKIRFRAHGENSFNIDWWLIDNILIKQGPHLMPFDEDWAEGTFDDNSWSAENNWSIITSAGNPAPTSRFYFSPTQTGYSLSLTSHDINGAGIIDINAHFDILFSSYSTTTMEQLSFEVYDGSDWNTVETFDNQSSSFTWTSFSYNISDFASDRIFKIRFRAHGENSYNINWWYIDNVLIQANMITLFPYFEDFEDGAGGWTSGAISGVNHWELGTPAQTQINAAHSGSNAWMTRLNANYDNNANTWLMSPLLDFSTLDAPYFSVWLNIYCENNYDGMILQSSIDMGSSWQNVIGNPGFYNNTSPVGPIPPPKWSGFIGSWNQYGTSLPALANQEAVLLRFRFGSDISLVSEGIAVDDIHIFNYDGPIIAVTPSGISESLPIWGSMTVPLTITNNGYSDLNFWISSSGLRENIRDQLTVRKFNEYPDRNDNYFSNQHQRSFTHNIKQLPPTRERVIHDPEDDLRAPATPFSVQEYHEFTRDLFDLIYYFPVGVGDGEFGIATDGNYIYTAKWYGTPYFYRYELNGILLGSFTVPGFPGGMRDMTYDGQYFYGASWGNGDVIYILDLANETMIGQITTSTYDINGIAYDAHNDGFWVTSGWYGPLKLINRAGETIQTINTAVTNMAGLAWDGVNPGGAYLWVYSQAGTPSDHVLHQINLNDGSVVQSFDVASLGITALGAVAGGMDMTNRLVPGKWTFIGTSQNDVIWFLELTDLDSWLSVTPVSGTVSPGQSTVLNVNLDSAGLDAGLYNADLIIYHNALGDNKIIPVNMTVYLPDPLELPFTENWDSGDFTTNYWFTEGNWTMDLGWGNPEPSAMFYYYPFHVDYSLDLASWEIDATGVFGLLVHFDYHLNNYSPATVEELSFEVFDGNDWISLATFNNQAGSIPWTTHPIDISNYAANRVFKIRFRAHGEYSWSLNYWYVDNIHVEPYIPPIYPPANLTAIPGNNTVRLEWDSPYGILMRQHSNIPMDGYYQQFDRGYGVVFDLEDYPGALLDRVDFRHSSWGITGYWDYNIHVVNWADHVTIQTLGPFTTNVNDGWERFIDLNNIAGNGGLIGIFVEPMGNFPTNAYPVVDLDGVLNGLSLHAQVNNWSFYNLSLYGDFLIDLWIRPVGRGEETLQVTRAPLNTLTGEHHKAEQLRMIGEHTDLQLNRNRRREDQELLQDDFRISEIIREDYREFLGYNVYRNGIQINSEPLVDRVFIDRGLTNQITYTYYVTALYATGESGPSNIVEATPYHSSFVPPYNLTADVVDDNNVQLNWEMISSDGIWFQWDDGINWNSIGTGGQTQYIAAARFTPAQLADFGVTGDYLSMVRFFPRGLVDTYYTIYVWNGGSAYDPGNLLVAQQVIYPHNFQWNYVVLDTPVLIQPAHELWIGIGVDTMGGYPAGIDAGPAIDGFGNMFYLNGQWQTLLELNPTLNYNWNIHGFVSEGTGREVRLIGQNTVLDIDDLFSNKELSHRDGEITLSSEFTHIPVPEATRQTLTGFVVYRNGTDIANTTANITSYLDLAVEEGYYQYFVSAVYEEGPSGFSNDATAVIIPEDQLFAQIGTDRTTATTLPFNFFWGNSLTETIYMAEELNISAGAEIIKIGYFNQFVSDLHGKHVKIWMGETSQTDLTAGWVQAGDLTLVFDGLVDFPVGHNMIQITLHTPYTYNGNNLVVMANRVWEDTWYSYMHHFLYTATSYPDRSRYVYSDGTIYDPYTITFGSLSNRIPNTAFFYIFDALEVPEVSISIIGSNVVLDWEAVPGANSYKIFAAEDPYTSDWGEPIAIVGEPGYSEAAIAGNRFYRVVASSDTPAVIRSSSPFQIPNEPRRRLIRE